MLVLEPVGVGVNRQCQPEKHPCVSLCISHPVPPSVTIQAAYTVAVAAPVTAPRSTTSADRERSFSNTEDRQSTSSLPVCSPRALLSWRPVPPIAGLTSAAQARLALAAARRGLSATACRSPHRSSPGGPSSPLVPRRRRSWASPPRTPTTPNSGPAPRSAAGSALIPSSARSTPPPVRHHRPPVPSCVCRRKRG